MTGEISLSGKVLAIGGLKEKVFAAYRHSIKEIIIPEANLKDIEEIPDNIRKDIIFHSVKNCTEVLVLALVEEMPKTQPAVDFSSKRRSRHEYS